MKIRRLFLGCMLLCLAGELFSQQSYAVHGTVIDKKRREPVVGAAIMVVGHYELQTATDTLGRFRIEGVPAGIVSLWVTATGYRGAQTPSFQVAATTPGVNVELEEWTAELGEVSVRPSPFRKTVESPLSMHIIGVREIEKTPGGGRDVSRIVRMMPGVSFSPAGYRNDLIVRGGGPSENRFYMDGIEIPHINHFATQGATGGPVSLINADLIREIQFYTGAFPADRSGAMSSVLDFSLWDGDAERQTFKATLGTAEASLSGRGHFGERTTYLFSLRQSYLQMVFKMLDLPFLPNYTDGLFKVETKLSRYNTLTLIALGGIDRMKLNTGVEDDENAAYILSYLPKVTQETFTVGGILRHYAGPHTTSLTLSHNYLNNRNVKYRNNDESEEEGLMFDLRGREQKSTLRVENRTTVNDRWTLKENAELAYHNMLATSLSQNLVGRWDNYRTQLGFFSYGASLTAGYTGHDDRLKLSMGLRTDGNTYSRQMQEVWKQLSPRASVRYALTPDWAVSASSGLYHQLPPYTALAFKEQGRLANHDLRYMSVWQSAIGGEWRATDDIALTLEGFYKHYYHIPLSVTDGIPLTCKGADYGIVGNERLASAATGRTYGLELLFRWLKPDRLNLTGSFTWFRSVYRASDEAPYINSPWDNRFIINLCGTYELPHHWSLGAKVSMLGGTPYTPYDEVASSYVAYWDANGRSLPDYTRYNDGRSPLYTQYDVRIDKEWYFRRWRMGLFLNLQNVRIQQQDVFMSTGEVMNPAAPLADRRYRMKRVGQDSNTLVPSIGLTAEF